MKWRKGFSVDDLLEAYSAYRTINPDGSISAKFGTCDRWYAIFDTAVIDDSVSDSVRMAAVRKAADCEQNLTPEAFSKSYNRECRRLKRSTKLYLVAFPVWGVRRILKGRFRIDGVRLDLAPKRTSGLYTRVQKAREVQRDDYQTAFANAFQGVGGLELSFGRVEAATPVEAYELAMSAMDEVLAAFNFWDSSGVSWRMYTGLRRPLFEILVAPQVTVHHASGDLAYTGFWYDDWLAKEHTARRRNAKQAKIIYSNARESLKASQSSAWSSSARQAMCMLNTAFSKHDARSAFLSGWKVLELIGGEKDTASAKKVERAAKCFEAYTEMRLLGEHLRERRNLLTHSEDLGVRDDDVVALQLNQLVSPLFRFFIFNPFKFESRSEFWEFFDLSRDPVRRMRQARLLEHAAEFHRDE